MEYSFFIFNRIYVGIQSNNYFTKTIPILIDLVLLYLTYAFYNGYAEGYGQPEWRWRVEISKNIGAFNLSVKVNDILNQTRNLTHTVTANYEEDSYRLVMGRYILFGVKWNFGKMNAAHSARAQQAAMDMVF